MDVTKHEVFLTDGNAVPEDVTEFEEFSINPSRSFKFFYYNLLLWLKQFPSHCQQLSL